MKKTVHHIVFYLVLLPMFMLKSCDCDEPIPYYPIDQDFLSYFAFPVGSWWVYEEVNTGERDSCYVFNRTRRKDRGFLGRRDGCGIAYDYEILFQQELIRNDTSNGVISLLANSEEVEYYYFKRNGIINLFKFPDESYNTFDVKIKNYDSLEVAGHFYIDVVVIDSSQTQIEYYSKNVGVIRREFEDGTQWELVKYHIN